MAIAQNRVIHRFIRPIADYEEGGIYYSQVIPIDTQAYAYYPEDAGRDTELWYVFGDGIHTYTEIRDSKGITESTKEFPVFTQDFIDIITNTYSKEEVDKLISHIHSFKVEIVDELPETGENNILYLVSKDPDDKNLNKPEGHNYYDEYVWIDTYFEYIGNTSSTGNFVTHEELDKILQTELSAEYIKYSNENYDYTNVKEALNNKQDTSNLVTSISSSSTDTQYPSAKCVYDAIENNIISEQLPSQSGNNGKFLTTDGTNASWSDVVAIILRQW